MKYSREKEIFKFITDSEGSVSLGTLNAVKAIYYSLGGINRTWSIDRTLDNYNYDRVIYAFPGEQITIPVEKSWTVKDVLLLHYLSDKCEKNDETEIVSVMNGLLTFKVAHLKSSSYKLSLFPIAIDIAVEVVWQGLRWKNKHGD